MRMRDARTDGAEFVGAGVGRGVAPGPGLGVTDGVLPGGLVGRGVLFGSGVVPGLSVTSGAGVGSPGLGVTSGVGVDVGSPGAGVTFESVEPGAGLASKELGGVDRGSVGLEGSPVGVGTAATPGSKSGSSIGVV